MDKMQKDISRWEGLHDIWISAYNVFATSGAALMFSVYAITSDTEGRNCPSWILIQWPFGFSSAAFHCLLLLRQCRHIWEVVFTIHFKRVYCLKRLLEKLIYIWKAKQKTDKNSQLLQALHDIKISHFWWKTNWSTID